MSKAIIAQELKAKGKTNAEIAQEMGVTEQWVRQLLKRHIPGTQVSRSADEIAKDLEDRAKQMLDTAKILRGKKVTA
jgi:predicted transcriptional regulator